MPAGCPPRRRAFIIKPPIRISQQLSQMGYAHNQRKSCPSGEMRELREAQFEQTIPTA
jgi:hypothetical protein